MSEQQADWVESIEMFGHWGDVARCQAEASAEWQAMMEGE